MDVSMKLSVAEMKKQLTIKGWKYTDLAEATGYSVSALNKLISGERTSERLINSVAKVLDIKR